VVFESHGVPVTVTLETDYPFRDTLTISVKTARAVRFPLLLRVPAWADGASVTIAVDRVLPMKPGTMHRIEREWSGTTQVVLKFPMKPLVTERYNEALAIERGPLVYSLKLGEEWTRVNATAPHRELPHGDFEVRPSTPWNYGLVVDEPVKPVSRQAPVVAGLTFAEHPVGDRPFTPEGAGMVARARARRIPNWKLAAGWAAETSTPDLRWADHSRVISTEPIEDITLIPYGCTNIRITEFPKVGRD
jgi:uncharacterized protein